MTTNTVQENDLEKIIKQYIGGQIETTTRERDYCYRGEISDIAIKKIDGGKSLNVDLAWCAKFNYVWVKDTHRTYSQVLHHPLGSNYDTHITHEGVLIFSPESPFTKEYITLYPKGHSKNIARSVIKDSARGLQEDTKKMKLYGKSFYEQKTGSKNIMMTYDALLRWFKIYNPEHQNTHAINIETKKDNYGILLQENAYGKREDADINTYLIIPGKGVLHLGEHHIMTTERYYDASYGYDPDETFNLHLKNVNITPHNDKLDIAISIEKEHNYHDGYSWRGDKYPFVFNYTVDMNNLKEK